MPSILIVDDEQSIRHALAKFLQGLDYKVYTAENGERGLEIVKQEPIDLALVDLVMPRMDGVEFIRRLKKEIPHCVAIVLTGFGTIRSAVDAVKAGAYHYLTKPFELDDISSLIQTALEHRQLKEENEILKKEVQGQYGLKNMIGKSEAMRSVFNLIDKVAATDSTVLILGESGTGKELVAKALHYNSPRKNRPLMTVNCGAIPEELLESELFGHMRGSFTGAVQTTTGRFLAANQGTIFLDEIGEMPMKLQVKLLRVLQEKKVEPVGSNNLIDVDVRIIAATNCDLEEAVRNGKFREDLYYRLNVIPISIAPLRERTEDIPLLVQHFVERLKKIHQKEIRGIDEKAKKILLQYSWPGNVRELENVLERIIILKEDTMIHDKDLPDKLRGLLPSSSKNHFEIPDTGVSFKNAVGGFESELILKALRKAEWNKNRAAWLLKLNRTTLVEKIKKRGLLKQIPKS